MAKDSKAGSSEAPAPAKPAGKGKLILILSLVLGAAASGGGVWFYMKSQASHTADAEVKKKPAPVFLPLDNFTVNLADREHYLQVGVTFEVHTAHDADAMKLNMPIIRSKILLLLASKNANELASPEGKATLMGELVAQAKEAVPDPAIQEGIETVHFSAFVIQ
jgi:flagellar FliL protein